MSAKNRKTGNLVALGSAAVVAVYGAGFMRTAEAAQRFAEQSDERRVVADDAAPSGTVPDEGAAATAAPNAATNVATNVATNAAPTLPAPQSGKNSADATHEIAAPTVVKKVDATTAKVAEQSAPISRTGAVSVPMPPEVTTVMSSSGVAITPPQPSAPAETRTTVAEKAAPTANPAPQTVTPAPAAPVAAPVPAPVAPAPTTKAAPVAEAAPPSSSTAPTSTVGGATPYKDGNYTGYGTSRHGDVEVYLETTAGKITYVKISQCLTQYSCSWIEDLPKQVLARQSTKVDGVSGATQSANAFYYALVAALAKAK